MAEDSNRLFVGNIPFRMTQDELHDLFSQAGAVVSVHIPTDRETGRPRGFGFVQMEDDTSKEQAVQMFNGYSVSGRGPRGQRGSPPRTPLLGIAWDLKSAAVDCGALSAYPSFTHARTGTPA